MEEEKEGGTKENRGGGVAGIVGLAWESAVRSLCYPVGVFYTGQE